MKFLKFLLVTIVALITLFVCVGVYARFIEPNLLIVNRLKIENPNVATPFKLVFFGDTHMGEFNDTDQLNRIVEKINAENPDLVIFTGDLIGANGEFTVDTQEIARILGKIHATDGKVAVIGNHEYALTDEYNYPKLMNSAGFSVLVNDCSTFPISMSGCWDSMMSIGAIRPVTG